MYPEAITLYRFTIAAIERASVRIIVISATLLLLRYRLLKVETVNVRSEIALSVLS